MARHACKFRHPGRYSVSHSWWELVNSWLPLLSPPVRLCAGLSCSSTSQHHQTTEEMPPLHDMTCYSCFSIPFTLGPSCLENTILLVWHSEIPCRLECFLSINGRNLRGNSENPSGLCESCPGATGKGRHDSWWTHPGFQERLTHSNILNKVDPDGFVS